RVEIDTAAYERLTTSYKMYKEGEAHVGGKRWEQAVASLAESINLDPTLADAYYQLGIVLAQQQKFDEASIRFRELSAKMLEEDPKAPAVCNEIAWILATCPDQGLRDAKRALALANRAVELKPEVATFWNTLGVALYRARDWKAAVAALMKSV